jgi:bifunctional oligoribonuclease and PAP phosphatase NrnA
MTTVEAYESTASASELAAWVGKARRVTITTHSKPDGDAVGATLALARAVDRAGGESEIVYAGPWPARFDPVVASDRPVRIESEISERDKRLSEPDAVMVLDTGSWGQLREIAPWLRSRRDKAAIIDHHRAGAADVAPRRLIDPEACAACELVADVCVRLLGLDSPARLPAEIAEPLYLGVASDTGWFRHANTTPAALRLASDLLAAGVDHPRLYQRVEQGDRAERLRLIARALTSLELHEEGRVAVSSITKKDFEATGGTQGDTGGFAEIPMSIGSVRVSAALTEVDGEIRVSLRSKSADGAHGLVDVNAVASALGGGGHIQAAGARLTGSVESARQRVLQAIRERL